MLWRLVVLDGLWIILQRVVLNGLLIILQMSRARGLHLPDIQKLGSLLEIWTG